MRRRSLSFVFVLVALLAAAAPAAAADPEYFQLPSGYNALTGVAPAPDGTVWFAVGRTFGPAEIGRLSPAQASPGTANGIDTFPTPTLSASCCVHDVRGMAFDARSSRAWFVQTDGIVGWADPAAVSPGTTNGMRATLLSTSTRSGPFSPSLADIAVDRSGLAWFTEYSSYNVDPFPGGRLARVDASMGVSELNGIATPGGVMDRSLYSLRYDSKPAGIAIDSLDRPWFAESEPGNPGWRIATPSGSDYTEYLVTPCAPSPCSGSFTGTGITDVAVAPDDSIWFTNQLRNEVGRLNVAGSAFTSYSLPAIDRGLANGQPRAIATAPDGTLWVAVYGGYSYPNANAIVKLVPGTQAQPDPALTVIHLGGGKFPLAVAPDTRGNVWFTVATDAAPGLIGRLSGVVGVLPGGGGSPGRVVRPVSYGVARAGTPTPTGASLRVDQICVGPPEDRCSLVYILSAHEYVTGFPGSRSARASALALAARARNRRARRARLLILGQKALTLHGGERRRVTITLNRAGRRLLARNGRLTVYFTITERTASGRPRRIKAVRVTFRVARRGRRARRR